MLRSRAHRLLLFAALAAGCSYNEEKSATLTVMSRNLYLGGNLDDVIGVIALGGTPQQIAGVAAATWGVIQYTDWPARAQGLADEIARVRPDVVGLQEVVLWRTQTPGNGALDATDVAYDFLSDLLAALAQRGLTYEVASLVQDTDAELFTAIPPSAGTDVRYTDGDAILVRQGIRTREARSGNYASAFPVGSGISAVRGWTSVEVEAGGQWVRVVNTHLEVDQFPLSLFQSEQARELLSLLGESTLPLVLTGDLNSDANGGGPGGEGETPVYELMRAAGLRDPWSELRPGDPGLTCCFNDDLSSADASGFYSRIDFTLYRGSFTPLDAGIIGKADADKIPVSGPPPYTVWPSDHAGFWSRLELRWNQQ